MTLAFGHTCVDVRAVHALAVIIAVVWHVGHSRELRIVEGRSGNATTYVRMAPTGRGACGAHDVIVSYQLQVLVGSSSVGDWLEVG